MGKALRLDLCVPTVQAGGLKLSALTGLDLAGLLGDCLVAAPTTAEGRTRYPVAFVDGVSVSWPLRLPLIGEVEFGLGNEDGHLALRVPALPFITAPVEARIGRYVTGLPRRSGAQKVYRLQVRPGERVAVPVGMLGEIAVEAPVRQHTIC